MLLMLALLPASSPARENTAPAGPPETQLSRKEIVRLVEQYVDAIENRDFDTWRELLSPMHAGSAQLNREHFTAAASSVQSLSDKRMDGLTATLEIEYHDGSEEAGYLQMDPSGRIKYTPLVFRHPVRRACSLVKILLSDQVTLLGSTTSEIERLEAVWELSKLSVPLCGYNPLARSLEDRRDAAAEILYWLEENGKTFDNTKPFIPIVPDEFIRCIDDARPASR